MARLQLNKSSLARETKSLTMYQRFLPSLDLKRQQLMSEKRNALSTVNRAKQQAEDLRKYVGEKLPMVANEDIDLHNLVEISHVDIGEENLVGTHLPYLKHITFNVHNYSLLAKPHWVDDVVTMLKKMLELQIQMQIFQQRLHLLNCAVKTVTQRVNLFEKVLIPKSQENIKRIKIFLSDEQMAAVVRSKISKRKRSTQ